MLQRVNWSPSVSGETFNPTDCICSNGEPNWESLPRRVPSSSSPAKTLTHHDLSSCTYLSPPSRETVPCAVAPLDIARGKTAYSRHGPPSGARKPAGGSAGRVGIPPHRARLSRSEEHTSELQSLRHL